MKKFYSILFMPVVLTTILLHTSCSKNKAVVMYHLIQDTLTFPATWGEIKLQKTPESKFLYDLISNNTDWQFQARTYDFRSTDINNDGEYDFKFCIQDLEYQETGFPKENYNSLECKILNNISLISYYGRFPDILPYGSTIDFAQPWSSHTYSLSGSTVTNGSLAGKGPCYIGFKKEVSMSSGNSDRGFLYGWIKVEINADGRQFILHDWAMMSQPDVPILAGQK